VSAYLDTGVIAKLYVLESDSAEAARLVSAYRPPLVFTHLQALEIRNALRLKVFRGEITRAQLRLTMSRLEIDIRAGRWESPRYALSDVYEKAEDLSRRFAPTTGCRSLDILHVAAAVVLKVRDFVTFDVRQGRLARKARLRLRPVRRE